MIYGEIADAQRYAGIHPGLDLALAHLSPEFLAGVGEEHTIIRENEVYAFKVHLKTLPEQEQFYENHHAYIDIHVLTEGEERIDVCVPQQLKLYEEHPENDAYFYHGGSGQAIVLSPGKFLVAFPEDAHRTCGTVDTVRDFEKVVFKIRI